MAILDDSYDVTNRYFSNESYVKWLESFTIDEAKSDDERLLYSKLIKELWSIEFRPSFGNDVDRALDGLELRARYNDILARKAGRGKFYTPDVKEIFGECRVLEMLVALSMHMYDFMQDMGFYNSVSRWFWEIMNRVGFDILDDDSWYSEDFDPELYINETCRHIMDRDGIYVGRKGGWFWIFDWENKEIWYQMHDYLKHEILGMQ